MNLTFYKYHGTGNDYLVYDRRKNLRKLSCKDIQKICHRSYGLGSDGILIGPEPNQTDLSMRVFNPDGSEGAKNGDGIQIFSKYLNDAGYTSDEEIPSQGPENIVYVGKMLMSDAILS